MADNGLRRVLMERLAKGGKVKGYSFGGETEGDHGTEGIGGSDNSDRGGQDNSDNSRNDSNSRSDARSNSDSGGFMGYGDSDFGGARSGVSPDAGSVDYGGFESQLANESRGLGGISFEGNHGDFGGYGDTEFGGPASPAGGPLGYDGGIGQSGTTMGLDGLGGRSNDTFRDYPDSAFNSPSVGNVDVPDTPVPGEDYSAGLNTPYGPNLDPLDELGVTAASLPEIPDVPTDVYGKSIHEVPRNIDFLEEVDKTNRTADRLQNRIADIETGYLPPDRSTTTPGKVVNGDRAYGYTQVMGKNIPGWTDAYYGSKLTPQEYRYDPYAQEVTTHGKLVADLTGGKFNRGVQEAPDFGMIVDLGKERTPSPEQVARDWVGHGVTDTNMKAADYASHVGRGMSMASYDNPGNVVVGDTINAPGIQLAGDDYSPLGGYTPPSPEKPAGGWQQSVWDDPTTYGPTPASGAPTGFPGSAFRDLNRAYDGVPMDPSSTRGIGYDPSSFDQAPYGMMGATGLGLDPITRGSPQAIRDLTTAGDDTVPTDYAHERTGKAPQSQVQSQGLPQSLDIGPLEQAHQARTSAYQGYNPDGTFPDEGVVAQPMTAFHEKAVGPIANGLLSATPLGMPNTIAGLAGMVGIGPGSGGGYLASHSTPGIDMSRGKPGNSADHESAYNDQALLNRGALSSLTKTQPSNTPAAPKTSQVSVGYTPPTFHAPKGDLTKYGYGSEQTMYLKEGGLASAVIKYRSLLDRM